MKSISPGTKEKTHSIRFHLTHLLLPSINPLPPNALPLPQKLELFFIRHVLIISFNTKGSVSRWKFAVLWNTSEPPTPNLVLFFENFVDARRGELF